MSVATKTFTATIYVGLRIGRTADNSAVVRSHADGEAIAQKYCDETGFCVSIKRLDFIYTNGREPGLEIGIINYPRFPEDASALRERALVLAEQMRVGLGQMRVSIVFADETVMLGGNPEAA